MKYVRQFEDGDVVRHVRGGRVVELFFKNDGRWWVINLMSMTGIKSSDLSEDKLNEYIENDATYESLIGINW